MLALLKCGLFSLLSSKKLAKGLSPGGILYLTNRDKCKEGGGGTRAVPGMKLLLFSSDSRRLPPTSMQHTHRQCCSTGTCLPLLLQTVNSNLTHKATSLRVNVNRITGRTYIITVKTGLMVKILKESAY